MEEKPKYSTNTSLAPPTQKGVDWKRQVELTLKRPPPGEPRQRTLWEPPEGYSSNQGIKWFYSDHVLNRNLPCREKYALWAIEKILKEYETGGTRFINLEVPEDISDVVRAQGQQDVDAEDGTISKDIEGDAVQPTRSAVQALISASPNSLGHPVEPCAQYLKMVKCGKYGNKGSTIWRSPLFPCLDNKDGRKGLLDHQITAVVWILSRFFGELPRLSLRSKDPKSGRTRLNIESDADYENRHSLRGPRYFGGILADSMGLGKTLVTVALLGLLTSQRLNVVRDKKGVSKHRPILILVPNTTLVSQWVDEIHQATDIRTIRDIVISGNGIKARADQQRATVLTVEEFRGRWPQRLDYMWDEHDPRASRSIIIMPIETWAGRTCRCRNSGDDDHDKDRYYSTFTNAGKKFSVVVVDEAFKVKNTTTLNWKSVDLLDRQFTLLITATPCMNTLTDVLGLARLLWKRPRQYLLQERTGIWEFMNSSIRGLEDLKQLEQYDRGADFQLVAGWPALLAKMLYIPPKSRNHDIKLIRDYFKYFETLAILRRSSASHLLVNWEGSRKVSLQGLFPNVKICTAEIKLDDALDRKYQEVHIDLLIRHIEALNAWSIRKNKSIKKDKDVVESISTTYRLFQIAAASLDVFFLDEFLNEHGFGTKATDVRTMRWSGVDFSRLWLFCQRTKQHKPSKAINFLSLAVRQSPILRYIFQFLQHNILNRESGERIKKVMIVEAIPILAFYYELALNLLGLNCRVLHADLSNEERQELIDDFNRDDLQSCQILIQMYTVGFTGTNLHKCCSQVLVASQATSYAVQQQTIHRVIRVGQMSEVTVTRIMVRNSFHGFRESRQVEKLLPELSARTHGDISILVRLLNWFQREVDTAWKGPKAQQLMSSKNLLMDSDTKKGESPSKRVKKEPTGESDESDESNESGLSSGTNQRSPGNALKRKQETHLSDYQGWFSNNSSHMTDEEAFLQIRTRNSYYAEFKHLSQTERSLLSHKKNDLRRLLSYGSVGGHHTTRVWTASDLDNTAVLERALELLVRVRLGADGIAMLPYPHIDFSHAPAHQRRKLCQLLRNLDRTAQDFEAACATESKDGAKEALKGVDMERSLSEIDSALEQQALGGGRSGGRSGGTKSGGRGARAHVTETQDKSEIKEEEMSDDHDPDEGPEGEDFGEIDWGGGVSGRSATSGVDESCLQGQAQGEGGEDEEDIYDVSDREDPIKIESGSESDSDCILTDARPGTGAPPEPGHRGAKPSEAIDIEEVGGEEEDSTHI
ncbi:P-loop containing nucleoside triphosphate hydrolase protein [Camillea tinctor]|nr:P-loop containing nucleoside triphosphate hydrolase protein [Camillea tinctor]